eukprot:CAMPEP_0184868298 /NCGR_PEP_ID=MMETSP0580-20130426/29921_1 /TAXON_ID=1118495 /ORGANISM="Dactyliosolen fragilissimus" /LENGTH=514 /DNA_ID=CAMNT_0027369095 /DNA_START=110 /DNA_END=1651 /DNA_ORIENTATION=+
MAYAYWKSGRHKSNAIFELFFRENPFGGEYTIFCGIDEVLKHLENFKFSKSDLDYLKTTPALQHCDSAFFDDYLKNLDCSEVSVHSLKQGSIAFPRVPLLIISGPLGITQLLETTLLNLVNYPSLIATNAARMVVAATAQFKENGKRLVEFGLRRAQGPDGAFSASKYSFLGGFDATSNVQAGKILGIPIAGTHAHAFVQSHSSLNDVKDLLLVKNGSHESVNLLEIVMQYRNKLGKEWNSTNDGELAAFISYATSFPNSFLCLIDTYDTLRSGLRNFIMVALALDDCGYVAKGIRLDSGDLCYFSLECAKLFKEMANLHCRPFLDKMDVVASNDINESVLHSLNKQGHAVTVFGIGTNLVTCQAQPALGCVYKLVELDGKPRMKLSQDLHKVLIPGQKIAYRLYGQAGWPLLDLMVVSRDDEEPQVGKRIMCRHPFIERKRVAVIPSRVEKLHRLVFDKGNGVVVDISELSDERQYVRSQIQSLRPDILRPMNPGQYKVSISEKLFDFLHDIW